ncbi:hypothetical protein ACIRST_14335 [Kitasatospora sp. NPDC101447]|uniref:hypothetical protein n=1 Tax=Kitasatospora sp. NPDC101447 TaxID=3364102 RepID=UPI0038119D95
MQTGDRTTARRWPVVLGMVLPLLLIGAIATANWAWDHGHGPVARHDEPGTDAGKARDSIQSALEGSVGAITPQVAHSDGWYWVVRDPDHWDGEPMPTSHVYRMWSLQARIDRSKYKVLADQLARYWTAHGYTVGKFQNFVGANTDTFPTDERQISATSPDGVLVTLEMDTPGVSLQAFMDGVHNAGTEVYGKAPSQPGHRLDDYSHQLTVVPPITDDPYWSHY